MLNPLQAGEPSQLVTDAQDIVANLGSCIFTKETEVFYFQGHMFCILGGTLPPNSPHRGLDPLPTIGASSFFFF